MSLLHNYKHQAFLFLVLWIISLVWSMEAITSISMIGLFVLSLFQIDTESRFKISFRKNIADNFKTFKASTDFLMVMVPFFLVLLTSIYSEDTDYTLERLRIKLPFLILPFAILSIPRFKRRTYFTLVYCSLLTTSSAVAYSLFNYWQNFEEVQQLLGIGQHIPVPINHIRFSLMIVYGIIGGGFLYLQNYKFKFNWERPFIGFLTLFLFVALHIFSVKSGIIALYLALFYLILVYIIQSRRYLVGILGILTLSLLPIVGYYTLPSLQTKINYSLYDFQLLAKGQGEEYSDSQRLVSMKNGLTLALQHPLLGVGAGDLKQEIEKIYKSETPNFRPHRPHNQFISIFAGTGIVGLLLFVSSYIIIAFYKRNYRDPLFTSMLIVLLFSFMIENTIENAVGVAFSCVFLLLSLKGMSRHYVEKD